MPDTIKGFRQVTQSQQGYFLIVHVSIDAACNFSHSRDCR